MKFNKFIFALVFFTLACLAANADITFNAWGRGVVTPLAFTTDEDGMHSSVSAVTYTSSDTPVIGFTATGIAPSQRIGFKIDLAYGGGSPGIGDNAKVWVKPFDVFTLTAGLFKEEELRGKIGASEFAAWILPNSSKNEDNIFQRFDAFAGAHFKLDPLAWWNSEWNGLTIQGAFGSNAPGSPGNNIRAILNLFNNEDNDTLQTSYDGEDRKMSALDVYKAMQIALGYRIPDIGLARFQFIGNNRKVFRWGEGTADRPNTDTYERELVYGMNVKRDADTIEAAFLYDGMEGLKLDLGVKIPLEYTTTTNIEVYPRVMGSDGEVKYEIMNPTKKEFSVQRPYVIALGANWTPSFFGLLNIIARFDVSFGEKIECSGDTEVRTGYSFSGWLMPSYTVLDGVRIGLDTGFEIRGKDFLKQSGITTDQAQIEPSEYFDFGIGPWVELVFGGGKIRTGIVMMLPGSARYNYSGSSTSFKYSPKFREAPVFSIPISFTYSL
jgi:hypothetical protein